MTGRRVRGSLILVVLLGMAITVPPAAAAERRVDRVREPIDARVLEATFRPRPGTSLVRRPTTISMAAARGEVESTWVVVRAPGGGRIVVSAGPLRGPGGVVLNGAIRSHLAVPANVRAASPGGRAGIAYDALVPTTPRPMRVAGGGRAWLWVDVAIPRAATPGLYTGWISLRDVDNQRGRRVGVRIRIHRTLLPLRPLLRSSIGLDWHEIARLEQVADNAVRPVFDSYAAMLAQHRLSTADLLAVPPGTLAGYDDPAHGEYLLRLANRSGVASVRVPIYESWPFEQPLGRDRDAAITYLRAVAHWYRAHGLLQRSYVYVVDEPSSGERATVAQWRSLVHSADPALRVLVTTEPSADFAGDVDIWAVNASPVFDVAQVRAAQVRGEHVWIYPSISSSAPWPGLFVDDSRPSGRALGWVAARYGLRGILYWNATRWSEAGDPWLSTATFRVNGIVGNGEGSLLYPSKPGGDHRPIASVRLKQLRDGVEDRDVFALASRCDAPELRRVVARLLATPTTINAGSGRRVAIARSSAFGLLARRGGRC